MTELSLKPRSSSRPLAVLVISALMLGSALAGAAVDRYFVRRSTRPPILGDTTFHPLSSSLRSPTPAERRAIREELSRQLALTPAQDSAVDAIMIERSGEFRALRDEIRPRVDRLVADVRRDLEQVLTPTQRARFRQLQQREHEEALGMSGNP